jgi:hypothetical protein
MSRLQHLGWFFSSGFRPQGWGRAEQRWGYRWQEPRLYQHSVRELEQAGLDLVVMEDAVSLGNADTLDLRVRAAYGGPKHDPLLLAPYLFDVTSRIGLAPTVNAGITPPYLAARQAATLQHLSGYRFGLNVVTDVGSARHVGAQPLGHDAAYDRAAEWTELVRRLWHSWGPGALLADEGTGRFADASHLDAFQHRGEYFDADGPLNAVPFEGGDDPVVVSPAGPREASPTPAPTRRSSSRSRRWTPRASGPTGGRSTTLPRPRDAAAPTSGSCSCSSPSSWPAARRPTGSSRRRSSRTRPRCCRWPPPGPATWRPTSHGCRWTPR